MLVHSRDGSVERKVLVGMIVSNAVLGRIVPKWEKGGLFSSRWSNLIGGWCVKYYDKYHKAPGRAIEGIYDTWATADTRDKATTELVEQFLTSLSEEYSAKGLRAINPDFLVDLAGELFNKVRLSSLAEEIQGEIDSGDPKKAAEKVDKFRRVEMGSGTGVDLLRDKTALKAAFDDKKDPLVTYPDALGTFFADALERDAFVSFMGKEKVGKSYWLMDVGWRAMTQGRRVAFFEVGDMSQSQVLRRLMTRASKHPIKAGVIKYPTRLDPDDPPTVTLDERIFTTGLDYKKARKALDKIAARLGDDTLFRLSVHPNSTINVHGIASTIETWGRVGGWVPDVVIIDYADIIAPINGAAETRDQINATWKALRALSQQLHCLVVTATQTDAASYRAETVDRSNFSEDKRKMAHVTGMVGINQNTAEKQNGIQRLNWVVLRESEFDESRCVYCAGCLAIGNPAIHSSF
jgi:hypothetical protein